MMEHNYKGEENMKIPIIPEEEMETVEQAKKRGEERKRREKEEKRIEEKERKTEKIKISKALDGYKFSRLAIKKMNRLNANTKKTNLEYGALLCGNPITKEINLSKECVGTECEVYIKREQCPHNTDDIGRFHTHPRTVIAMFEAVDIETESFACLGTPESTFENERLMCIILKDKDAPKERRWNELAGRASLDFVKQKYGQVRKVPEIVQEDYYEFNPDEFKK